MATKKAVKKPSFKVEYRVNGQWLPTHIKGTKAECKAEADRSSMCNRNGYQIVKNK